MNRNVKECQSNMPMTHRIKVFLKLLKLSESIDDFQSFN